VQLQIHLEPGDDGVPPDGGTLLSLQRLLANRPDVVQSEIGLTPGAVEIIELVLGIGLPVADLIHAIADWRRERRSAPAVVLIRSDPDGIAVRLDSADPAAADAAAHLLDG
jgi:hypothetical protein